MEKVFDLPGQFLLLCLDPHTGKIKPTWYNFSYGLAGSILLELGIRENILLRHGRVWMKDQRQPGDAILDDARKAILNSPRKKRPGQWLIRLSYRSRRYKRLVIADWEKRGLIRVSSRKILGFWAYEEVNLRDPGLHHRLKEHILQVISGQMAADERDLALLVLIDAGKLHNTLSTDPGLKQRMKVILDESLSQSKCHSRNLIFIRELRNTIRSVLSSAIGFPSVNTDFA